MRYRKTYGESKVATCPFCGSAAYSKNKDGLPVCADHKHARLGEMKCTCGEWLEQKKSKWGVFYVCANCGPQNLKRVLETNEGATLATRTPASQSNFSTDTTKKPEQKEFIHPYDPRFLPK